MIRASLLLLMLPAAAAAEASCEEWWYTRNLIFDRAGYCFSSPLGQALFDNSDCSTTEPDLAEDAQALVREIRFMEEEFECAVDVSATALSTFDPQTMQGWSLDVPVPSGYGGGCNGYLGAPFALYARRSESADITGEVPTGADIFFEYLSVGDWVYVTGRGIDGEGWVPVSVVERLACEVTPG